MKEFVLPLWIAWLDFLQDLVAIDLPGDSRNVALIDTHPRTSRCGTFFQPKALLYAFAEL